MSRVLFWVILMVVNEHPKSCRHGPTRKRSGQQRSRQRPRNQKQLLLGSEKLHFTHFMASEKHIIARYVPTFGTNKMCFFPRKVKPKRVRHHQYRQLQVDRPLVGSSEQRHGELFELFVVK